MEGDRQAADDLVGDGGAMQDGGAQVAVENAPDPVDVLDRQRFVQAEFVLEFGYLLFGELLRLALGNQHTDRVTGEQAHGEKDQDANNKQNYDQHYQASDDIGSHYSPLPPLSQSIMLSLLI